MRKDIHIISFFLILCLLLADFTAGAQNRRGSQRGSGGYGIRVEKKVVAPDSLTLARRDSIFRADSIRKADSLSMLRNSSLENPAFSDARDSVVQARDPLTGNTKLYYYGDVKVKYQDMELTADYMEYDMKTRTVFARGNYDSTKMSWVGRPKMTQSGKSYEMESLNYNFDTRKAFINNMITSENDGILHGQNIKMMDDRSINIKHGKYTVCDADHPHYYLALTSAKLVQNPSQKTIIGPSYLVLEDVKLPFIGLPFGFIPKKPERATGMLMPTFGEEQARGFYMRGLGMYFVFGDHLDLQVTGDYYTLGSWAINVSSRYNVRYKFNGGFNITYSNDQTGEKGTPEFRKMTNFGIRWDHSQDSKAHPGTTFRASVDLKSPSNNRYNSTSINNALQNQASSTISYSKTWGGKVSISLNARHSQSSRDSSYTFTLPNLSISVSTFYPFKRKERVGKEKIYEKISFAYRSSLDNQISFKSSEFGKENLQVNIKGVDIACDDELYALKDLKIKFKNAAAQKYWTANFERSEKSRRDKLAEFRIAEQEHFSEVKRNSGFVKDSRDGQMYRTIKIDGRTWLAQNVNYNIPGESWCYDDKDNFCARSGRLYSLEGARKACPKGFHLPRDREWQDMLTGLTGCYDGVQKCEALASKLKARTGWQGGGGTDEYGFTAFGSGRREVVGRGHRYVEMGEYTAFWKSLVDLKHRNPALAAGERGGELSWWEVPVPETVVAFSRGKHSY